MQSTKVDWVVQLWCTCCTTHKLIMYQTCHT